MEYSTCRFLRCSGASRPSTADTRESASGGETLARLSQSSTIEISEIRDLGERIVAIGELRGRGKESGAEVESPIGYVAEFKNGKVIRLDDYFDPEEALEAAGLSK